MALKLRRRTEMVTNENLLHRSVIRHPKPLGTGAASFKRVLDSARNGHLLQSSEEIPAA